MFRHRCHVILARHFAVEEEEHSMSNFKRNMVLSAALAALCAASAPALAARGHGGGGHWGGGHWGGGHHGGHWGWGAGAVIGGALVAGALLSPWYYRPYYYYPSYTVVEYPEPTVYYQQPVAPAAVTVAPSAPADAGNWWYYCNDTRSYYPYVQSCASQWQRVAPQAPSR
jgi:hypothetical protein